MRGAVRNKEIGQGHRTPTQDPRTNNTRLQVSSPFVIRNGLEYIDAVFGPPRDFIHGIAGAPYFNSAPRC